MPGANAANATAWANRAAEYLSKVPASTPEQWTELTKAAAMIGQIYATLELAAAQEPPQRGGLH